MRGRKKRFHAIKDFLIQSLLKAIRILILTVNQIDQVSHRERSFEVLYQAVIRCRLSLYHLTVTKILTRDVVTSFYLNELIDDNKVL